MSQLRNIRRYTTKSPGRKFVITFLLVYAVLYGFNHIWTGYTIPGGYYSYWIDENADYISWLRNLILQGSSTLLFWLNYDNHVSGVYLKLAGGKTVRMVYSCIGLNILCVWCALNIALPQRVHNMVINIMTGALLILALNMVRVAMVAISPYKGKFLNTPFDHHTVFNLVVYTIIIAAIMLIINRNTRMQEG